MLRSTQSLYIDYVGQPQGDHSTEPYVTPLTYFLSHLSNDQSQYSERLITFKTKFLLGSGVHWLIPPVLNHYRLILFSSVVGTLL